MDHWQSLVANLAVVALFISTWLQARFIFARHSRRWRNIAFGMTMGAGAVASMMLAIPIGNSYFDLRLSLVALAGFFGGPLSAFVGLIVAVIYRGFLGGPATLVAIGGMIATAIIGVVLSRLSRGRLSARSTAGLLAATVAGVSLVLGAILRAKLPGTITELSLPIAFMNALATALCAFFIMRNRVLDRERDLFHAALLESPDFQYVKTLDSRFAAVNLNVARINGFSSPDEMMGKTDFDLVEPDRANALLLGEKQIVESGEPLLDVEELLLDHAGNETWYLTSKVALHNADREIIGIAGATRDITASKRLRTEATESRNQLNYVLSGIAEGIAMFDRQGTLVYCNEQYRDLSPLTATMRRSGQHFRDILQAVADTGEQKGIPPGGEAAWIDEVATTLEAVGEQEIQLFNDRWLRVRTRPTRDGSALVVVSDITKFKDAEAELMVMTDQLKLLATTDGLTGLVNRRAFDHALEVELARHRRSQVPMAVLMIDVDRFKSFNDLYGHPAGDEALRLVGQCLKSALKRPMDVAARYGGEEFVAILPGTDEDGAFFVADEFRENLHALKLPHKGGDAGIVTASVGVAVITKNDAMLDAMGLVGRADEALYHAKEAGRDRTTGWRLSKEAAPAAVGRFEN